jgi:hypothetical protein
MSNENESKQQRRESLRHSMKWLRLYNEVPEDEKVMSLHPALFRYWICLLCFASGNVPRGTLPPLKSVAYRLHIKPAAAKKVLASLIEAELIDEMAVDGADPVLCIHAWDERQFESDDVTARTARHRRVKMTSQLLRGAVQHEVSTLTPESSNTAPLPQVGNVSANVSANVLESESESEQSKKKSQSQTPVDNSPGSAVPDSGLNSGLTDSSFSSETDFDSGGASRYGDEHIARMRATLQQSRDSGIPGELAEVLADPDIRDLVSLGGYPTEVALQDYQAWLTKGAPTRNRRAALKGWTKNSILFWQRNRHKDSQAQSTAKSKANGKPWF